MLRLFIVGFKSAKAKMRYEGYMKGACALLSEMPAVPFLNLLDLDVQDQKRRVTSGSSCAVVSL